MTDRNKKKRRDDYDPSPLDPTSPFNPLSPFYSDPSPSVDTPDYGGGSDGGFGGGDFGGGGAGGDW